MGHSVFVDDDTYLKLVRRAKKLNIPIGRAIDVGEDGGSGNPNMEKKQEEESKEKEEKFVSQEEFDDLVHHYNGFIMEVGDRLDKIEKKIRKI